MYVSKDLAEWVLRNPSREFRIFGIDDKAWQGNFCLEMMGRKSKEC